MNEAPSLNSDVSIMTSDGVMTEATRSGLLYAVKNVGEKVTIEVTHPVNGSATIETDLTIRCTSRSRSPARTGRT